MNWGWLPKHRQGSQTEHEHEQEGEHEARFNIDNYFFKFFKKGLREIAALRDNLGIRRKKRCGGKPVSATCPGWG